MLTRPCPDDEKRGADAFFAERFRELFRVSADGPIVNRQPDFLLRRLKRADHWPELRGARGENGPEQPAMRSEGEWQNDGTRKRRHCEEIQCHDRCQRVHSQKETAPSGRRSAQVHGIDPKRIAARSASLPWLRGGNAAAKYRAEWNTT
jgi:hypothetical protein